MTALKIDEVYGDFNTPGVPSSGKKKVSKSEVRRLLKQIAGGTAAVGDYRGTWDSEADYIATDLAEFGGSIWYSLVDNNNVEPEEGAAWTLFLAGVTAADGSISEAKFADALVAVLMRVVTSVSALKASNLSRFTTYFLVDEKRGGTFKWDSSDLSATLVKSSVTSTSVDAGTDIVTKSAHGLLTGQAVLATTAVNGLSLNTLYYVIKVSADTFKLASSYANAKASSAFNLTGTTNFTVQLVRDPVEAIYIIPDGKAKDGSEGALVRQYSGPIDVLWSGLDNAGVSQVDQYLEGMFTLLYEGDELHFPRGTYLIDGSINVTVSDVLVYGRGLLQKDGSSGVKPMLVLNDFVDNTTWRDLRWDGAKASFSDGNGVPGMLGHRNTGTLVTGCHFENFIDVGVKLRQSMKTSVIGCKFYNMGENGCEFRWYQNDPRTAAAWVGSLPAVYGDLVVQGNHFELIGRVENEISGLVDGCGVTFDIGAGALRAGSTVSVTGNTFVDCLRGVFCENNDASRPFNNVAITGNTMYGLRATPDAYVKMGIGLINVVDFTISGNSIRNIGNYDPYESDAAGIVLSGNSRDGVVTGNAIFDDRADTDRMDYCIQLTQVERVIVSLNKVGGASVSQIFSGTVTDSYVQDNLGA